MIRMNNKYATNFHAKEHIYPRERERDLNKKLVIIFLLHFFLSSGIFVALQEDPNVPQ